jgi:hypothetical protein
MPKAKKKTKAPARSHRRIAALTALLDRYRVKGAHDHAIAFASGGYSAAQIKPRLARGEMKSSPIGPLHFRAKPAGRNPPRRATAAPKRKRKKKTSLRVRETVVVRRRTVASAQVSNPRRPPKRWFDSCLRSVAAKKYARDPAAVCAAAWWRRPPADRAKIVRRLERGSPRERRTAVAIAKAEARRADGPQRRRNPGMSDAGAVSEYERTHWGERGRGRVQRARAADPTRGTATQLGQLVAVTYRTKKKGDGGPVDYEHEFEGRLPRLLYNEGGLFIAGGDYVVKTGGITG